MNKGWKELHKNGFIRVGIFGALVFSVAWILKVGEYPTRMVGFTSQAPSLAGLCVPWVNLDAQLLGSEIRVFDTRASTGTSVAQQRTSAPHLMAFRSWQGRGQGTCAGSQELTAHSCPGKGGHHWDPSSWDPGSCPEQSSTQTPSPCLQVPGAAGWARRPLHTPISPRAVCMHAWVRAWWDPSYSSPSCHMHLLISFFVLVSGGSALGPQPLTHSL